MIGKRLKGGKVDGIYDISFVNTKSEFKSRQSIKKVVNGDGFSFAHGFELYYVNNILFTRLAAAKHNLSAKELAFVLLIGQMNTYRMSHLSEITGLSVRSCIDVNSSLINKGYCEAHYMNRRNNSVFYKPTHKARALVKSWIDFMYKGLATDISSIF